MGVSKRKQFHKFQLLKLKQKIQSLLKKVPTLFCFVVSRYLQKKNVITIFITSIKYKTTRDNLTTTFLF